MEAKLEATNERDVTYGISLTFVSLCGKSFSSFSDSLFKTSDKTTIGGFCRESRDGCKDCPGPYGSPKGRNHFTEALGGGSKSGSKQGQNKRPTEQASRPKRLQNKSSCKATKASSKAQKTYQSSCKATKVKGPLIKAA